MSNGRILIVEDEISVARDLQMDLEEMGFTVSSIVPSGDQAIQKIEDEDRPDLVLMDISLQGKMNGMEAARIINTRFDLPVIYLTSYLEESVLKEAKSTNPYGYLTKPFKKDELQKVLELGLYRHRSDKDRRMLVTELKDEIVERNRVEKELEKHVRQQRVITFLGHKALRSHDLIDLMNEVVKKVAETLDNEFCKVLELLPDCDEMILRAGVGWKEGLVGKATVHIGLNSQSGYTLNSRKPIIVEDLKTEKRFSGSPFLHEHNVVSGMSVTIQGPDGPWGVLGTHTTRHITFTIDDVNFLYSVANILTNAIVHKKTEDTLEESKEKYRKLIETAQDAIISFDERGIINLCNRMAVKVFGYSVSEIIGQPVTTIIPDIYKNERQIDMNQLLNLSVSNIIDTTMELSGKTKAGTEFPMEMSLSYHKTKNTKYISTAIIRDITFQRKAKEQLIEKTMEVEKANKELKEFVYTVSHDLKEPLFSIDGYATRLHETYRDIYDETGKRYSDRIKINIKLMSDRIYEILEVAKIGLVAYNFKDIASEDIVKDVIKTLEDKIESNNVNILIKHNLPTISCDEKRMRDVFFNLVTNSIKFMGNDKQRQITIGCDKDGNYYKFFVEDTGIGIRKEYQNSVFKIFSRLKDVEVEGTGVGLVIVKKIIDIHKGKLWIESPIARGKGSRFCFTMPISS
jgi:PAS domain S-box-containing protein